MNTLEIDQATDLDARITATGVFKGLSQEQLADLESMGVYMEYHQEPVVADGHDMGYFFYVLRGVLEVSKVDAQTDKKTILAKLGLGQCFGEMSRGFFGTCIRREMLQRLSSIRNGCRTFCLGVRCVTTRSMGGRTFAILKEKSRLSSLIVV